MAKNQIEIITEESRQTQGRFEVWATTSVASALGAVGIGLNTIDDPGVNEAIAYGEVAAFAALAVVAGKMALKNYRQYRQQSVE